MSEATVPSMIDSIKKNADRQRYRPKSLIHIVRKGPKNRGLSERQQVLFQRFKHLIELDVLSTELIATEGRRHAPDRNFQQDTIECYSQEFKFSERTDKLIYNEFREMRELDVLKLADVEILIIEPAQDFLSAADAWLFQGMELSRIRNAHTPRRDIGKALEQDPEGKDFENFTTTIALYGKLRHEFALMSGANYEMSRMNPSSNFGPGSIFTRQLPESSTAHCDAAARL